MQPRSELQRCNSAGLHKNMCLQIHQPNAQRSLIYENAWNGKLQNSQKVCVTLLSKSFHKKKLAMLYTVNSMKCNYVINKSVTLINLLESSHDRVGM